MMIPLGLFFEIGGPSIEEIVLRDYKGEFDENRQFRFVDLKFLKNNPDSDTVTDGLDTEEAGGNAIN